MKWLKVEKPKLAAEGCGKKPNGCGRLNNEIPEIPLDHYGPFTMEEATYAFPKIPNTNGRPERTSIGGAHIWEDYEPIKEF